MWDLETLRKKNDVETFNQLVKRQQIFHEELEKRQGQFRLSVKRVLENPVELTVKDDPAVRLSKSLVDLI